MKKLKQVEPDSNKNTKRKKKKSDTKGTEKSHEDLVEEKLQISLKAAKEHQTLLHQLNLPEINIATLPSYTRKHVRTEEDDKVCDCVSWCHREHSSYNSQGLHRCVSYDSVGYNIQDWKCSVVIQSIYMFKPCLLNSSSDLNTNNTLTHSCTCKPL